jgi:hypothetical protein
MDHLHAVAKSAAADDRSTSSPYIILSIVTDSRPQVHYLLARSTIAITGMLTGTFTEAQGQLFERI